MLILIAGPYRSGTNDDPALMEKNLRKLEEVALPLFRAGHIPMIGEWVALPLLREAGSKKPSDAPYTEIAYPVAERLLTNAMQSCVWKANQKELIRMCELQRSVG